MIRRSVLVTTASVAGVVVAGAAVVGANVKILDSAADEGVGQLSATTVPLVEEASLDSPDESQSYAVDAAGTVSVDRFGGELRLAEVTTTPGWTHSVSQQSATVLVIAFTDGTTTYQFLGTIGSDGGISAGVSQPVDEVVVIPGPTGISPGGAGSAAPEGSAAAPSNSPTPAPSRPRASGGGDDHESDEYEYEYEYEDDDDHDEEHESEEHEGGDDDD